MTVKMVVGIGNDLSIGDFGSELYEELKKVNDTLCF